MNMIEHIKEWKLVYKIFKIKNKLNKNNQVHLKLEDKLLKIQQL